MEEKIEILSKDEALAIFGNRDRNIKKLREVFCVNVVARNNMLKLTGEAGQVRTASEIIRRILDGIRRDGAFSPEAVGEMLSSDIEDARPGEELHAPDSMGKVKLRTDGQRAYMEAMEKNDVIFCIGPAGTGKTFLAVAMAIRSLKEGAVRKIILVRPAVEAGEKLGFLPGDFHAKINPYLRPLYDSLYFLLDAETVRKYIERDIIEICPLAYMRGRTLANAFIILDEAQNTTTGQMKMFLTRMGEKSKVVVTGDDTQVDLARPGQSGLVHAPKLLKKIKDIVFCRMTRADVVRHRIVQEIIEAYENAKKPGSQKGPSGKVKRKKK